MQMNTLPQKYAEPIAILKAISGSIRFKILILLHDHAQGLRVGEIASIINGSTSGVSYQLRILRKLNIITATGTDHQATYTLNHQRISKLLDAICVERE